MSRLVAVISTDEGAALAPEVQARLLDAVRVQQGAGESGSDHDRDRAELWSEGGVVLGVRRAAWELGASFSGPVLVVEDHDCVVVADATLYYRDELRRRLAAHGVRPRGQTASHLILAAYRAWGSRCAEHLEGDFSFVVWDRRRRTVTAARDFAGRRPLYYTTLADGTLLLASTLAALLEHPGCHPALDLDELAVEAAALIFSVSDRTCYRGIERLSAGCTLVKREEDSIPRISRGWYPEVREPPAPTSLDAGAEELRATLESAVLERLDPDGDVTSVWMSGGWDSTAVFASAKQALLHRGSAARVQPVSFSLPADDPGCENELIAAVCDRWQCAPRWVRSADVPLLSDPETDARARMEPWAYEFASIMRAVAQGSRAVGSHVALDGHGGDFLFYSSAVTLADLLARGRFSTLRREMRVAGIRTPRAAFHWAVQPLLPLSALAAARWLRGGRPLHGYLERPVPTWMITSGAHGRRLAERAHAGSPVVHGRSRSAYEMEWLLTRPHFHRVVSSVNALALAEDVELRSPLFDRRVIEVAARRPFRERRAHGERKILVRHAMRGLLPDEVLSPRAIKTGTLSGYLTRSAALILAMLRSVDEVPALTALGIVDGKEFRRRVEQCGATMMRDQNLAVRLLCTAQVELWTRAHHGFSGSAADFTSEPAANTRLALAG